MTACESQDHDENDEHRGEQGLGPWMRVRYKGPNDRPVERSSETTPTQQQPNVATQSSRRMDSAMGTENASEQTLRRKVSDTTNQVNHPLQDITNLSPNLKIVSNKWASPCPNQYLLTQETA